MSYVSFCNPSLGHIAKRIDNRFSRDHLHTFAHCSMSHRNREGGSNLPIHLPKWNLAQSLKRRNPVVCDNMDEP